jgi:ribosomal-protein-alanine N-acetyltransferase
MSGVSAKHSKEKLIEVNRRGLRVFLRAPSRADAKELIALNRASRSLHRGLVSPPINHQQFASYLRRCDARNHQGFVVCRVEDAAIVGVMNLSEIVKGFFRSAYLGYYALEPFAGRGYMTEGMSLLLHHAFKVLKLHRIEANIQPQNEASKALVKRAGFKLEGYSPRYLKVGGRWRDHERWALLVEDWRAARRRSDLIS